MSEHGKDRAATRVAAGRPCALSSIDGPLDRGRGRCVWRRCAARHAGRDAAGRVRGGPGGDQGAHWPRRRGAPRGEARLAERVRPRAAPDVARRQRRRPRPLCRTARSCADRFCAAPIGRDLGGAGDGEDRHAGAPRSLGRCRPANFRCSTRRRPATPSTTPVVSTTTDRCSRCSLAMRCASPRWATAWSSRCAPGAMRWWPIASSYARPGGYAHTWRTLVEPGLSMFGEGVTSGSFDAFGQLENHFHVQLDADADGHVAVAVVGKPGLAPLFAAHADHFGEPTAITSGLLVSRLAAGRTAPGHDADRYHPVERTARPAAQRQRHRAGRPRVFAAGSMTARAGMPTQRTSTPRAARCCAMASSTSTAARCCSTSRRSPTGQLPGGGHRRLHAEPQRCEHLRAGGAAARGAGVGRHAAATHRRHRRVHGRISCARSSRGAVTGWSVAWSMARARTRAMAIRRSSRPMALCASSRSQRPELCTASRQPAHPSRHVRAAR